MDSDDFILYKEGKEIRFSNWPSISQPAIPLVFISPKAHIETPPETITRNTYFSFTCYVNHNQENSLKHLNFESCYTLF